MKSLGRIGVTPQRLQGSAVVILIDSLVGIDGNGTANQLQGRFVPSLLLANNAKEVQVLPACFGSAAMISR